MRIECSFCHDELTEPGALIFGPPASIVRVADVPKMHLCVTCFGRIHIGDDLDAFIREQAAKDPAFATSYLSAGVRSLLERWIDHANDEIGPPVAESERMIAMLSLAACPFVVGNRVRLTRDVGGGFKANALGYVARITQYGNVCVDFGPEAGDYRKFMGSEMAYLEKLT